LPIPIPIEIHRDDHQIVLKWTAEHETAIPSRTLRLACHCAQCRNEMTGEPILDEETVPEDVKPMTIELVGAYGFRVDWSDGHGTGIYTYESLYPGDPNTEH
jgi:ATP-binding protein involved in chromosome partitioning